MNIRLIILILFTVVGAMVFSQIFMVFGVPWSLVPDLFWNSVIYGAVVGCLMGILLLMSISRYIDKHMLPPKKNAP